MDDQQYIIPGREAMGRQLLPGIGARERPYIYIAAGIAVVLLVSLLPIAIPLAFGSAAIVLFATWATVTKQNGTSVLEFIRRFRAFSKRPKRYVYTSKEI